MRKRIRTNLKRQVKDGKASIMEVMKTSAVRTQVYEIQDPSERLVATVGACMFNEPKFYPTDPQIRRDADGNIIGHQYCADDLDEQAQMIINTAMEIAESESPRDLLAIARWAREELKMRTIPQVLVAVAAEHSQTKQFVRSYCPKIIQRADELKQVFTAYRHLYGTDKMLPNPLKRGLADSFSGFRESDFLKYEGQGRPHFADVLKMVDRKKDYPLKKALDTYLRTGEVTDPKAIPVIAARKELNKLENFDEKAKELAKKSFATWENLSSQFGNSKEMWEHLIDSNRLPPMAMMRNLRNLIKTGVSTKHLRKVSNKLVENATGSKQLPFRYVAAEQALSGEWDQWGYYHHKTPGKKEQILLDGVRAAAEEVCNTIPEIPGTSLVAVDNSGSMSSPVSQKSKMSMNSAAAILGAMTIKRSAEGSEIGGFGESWKVAKISPEDTVLGIAHKVQTLNVGHSTNTEKVLRWAIQKQKHFDRIIVFSDMQTYGGAGGYSYWGRSGESVKDLIEKYRKEVNPDCKLHCIDLAGHGYSLTEQADTQTNLVAGFSERLLDTILEFEGLASKSDDDEEDKQVFTIEYIRENF